MEKVILAILICPKQFENTKQNWYRWVGKKTGGLGSRGDEIDEQYKFRTTKVKSTSLSFGRHGDFGEFGAAVDGN